MGKAKSQRTNHGESPLESVLASLPKRIDTSQPAAQIHGEIHARVLKRSGLGAAFKKNGGWLYKADERWLDRAYELGAEQANQLTRGAKLSSESIGYALGRF